LKVGERQGLVVRKSVFRERENERLVGHGGFDGNRTKGLHELGRGTGRVVGNESIVFGYRLVRMEMAVFLVGVAAAPKGQLCFILTQVYSRYMSELQSILLQLASHPPPTLGFWSIGENDGSERAEQKKEKTAEDLP
jgi:hypothetical protein